jgi:hypothetical protein
MGELFSLFDIKWGLQMPSPKACIKHYVLRRPQMNYAKTASKLREQIIKFSGELSAGWPKVVRRFIAEALYGIQARQSVRLTEIARSLEERIPLRKTQYRLCRQLGRRGLWARIADSLSQMASSRVKEETLLVLDISDIAKKYAEKMEYLALVHDGSEGSLANGYWTCSVIGAEVGESAFTPLYNRLYSQAGPDFRSENAEVGKAMSFVSEHTEKRGIWVLDRGGDRREIIHHVLDEKLRFILRLKKDRHLVYRGKKQSVYEHALACPPLYAERIVKEDRNKEKIYHLEFGYRPVKLPGRKEQLYMVVVRGFGQEPMMLLTNMRIKKSRKALWRIIESYMTRWRIEETIRFIKQSYNLEDIRLLTYRRLQNMMALVLAVAYFTMVYLGLKTKLRVMARHVLKAARRLFGIPDFRFYALADGIRELLFGRQKGLEGFSQMLNTKSMQMDLFDP